MNRKKTSKPLMSELLKDTRKYIEQAERTDVEPLRQFLFNEPERPLIAMGQPWGMAVPILLPPTLPYSMEPTVDLAES